MTRLLTALALLATALTAHAAETKPNVIIIYVDDLGYGDPSCYGATKVKTPHVDRLAKEGLRFTSGYAPSATCTPSRYAMMTGEYAWRQKGTGIAPGNAPAIIKPGRTTLASILKSGGYRTGVVGKWHLGLGDGNMDWNADIKPGPLEIGFDYCFLIPATGDRTPCVYVENHKVVGLDPADPIQVSYGKKIGNEPTGKENPDLLKMKLTHGHDQTIVNGISRIGYMSGGKSARWVDEDMADVITKKAVSFIEQGKDKPFFLYFAFHDIHVPRVPHARFVGTSETGTRGDVIHQMDWCVGEVLAALDRLKIADNTMVIFTSDNGPVLDDGYADGAVEKLNGHKPAGPLKGGKYSMFEGGTRVPFIVRWPARIKPGVSDAIVSHVDFPTSLGKLAGQTVSVETAPDSFDVLAALVGESPEGRDHIVEHAAQQALRKGDWKLVPRGGRGQGNRAAEPAPGKPPFALYNLADDIGETKDLSGENPEKVKELADLLQKIKDQGHSRAK